MHEPEWQTAVTHNSIVWTVSQLSTFENKPEASRLQNNYIRVGSEEEKRLLWSHFLTSRKSSTSLTRKWQFYTHISAPKIRFTTKTMTKVHTCSPSALGLLSAKSSFGLVSFGKEADPAEIAWKAKIILCA